MTKVFIFLSFLLLFSFLQQEWFRNMKVLITGGAGFVAQHLLLHLHQVLNHVQLQYTFRGTDALQNTALGSLVPGAVGFQMDLTDKASVRACLFAANPDVVIHTAAFCDTGKCEKDPVSATAVNVTGVSNLVNALQELRASREAGAGVSVQGAYLVHFSSDWCYDGSHANSSEAQRTAQVGFGVYGKSKQAGEEVLLCSNYLRCTVLRSALVYGLPAPFTGKHSCLGWIFAALLASFATPVAEGTKKVTLFSNEFRSAVCIADVCSVVERLINGEQWAEHKQGAFGGHRAVLNMGGAQRQSRLEFGEAIVRAILPLVDAAEQKKTISDALCSAVSDISQRPADLSMDSSQLQSLLTACDGGGAGQGETAWSGMGSVDAHMAAIASHYIQHAVTKK